MPSLRLSQNIFQLQPLEIRRLLTTAVVGANNTLDILGTAANDTITVNRNTAGRLTVTGVTAQFTIGSGAGQVNKILIQGAGGSDTILLTNNVRFPANNAGIPSTIAGNAGNDTITGGPGNDIINGNDGNDMMDGGGGNDEFTGGNNFDTVNYSVRTGAIDVDFDNIADDGQGSVGENDNVTATVEEVIGGAGNDIFIGSGNGDYMGGGGGNDSMVGGNGNDQMVGSAGGDTFLGQNGNDFMFAQNNDRDTVNGGTNSDGTADTDLASIDPLDVAAAAMARALAAAAAGATLDNSFDDNGIALGPPNLGWAPQATAVDAQGRVYFAGTDFLQNADGFLGNDIVVARLNADGSFDTTLGQNGVAAIDFTIFNGSGFGYNDDDRAGGMAVDASGRIVVVGGTRGAFDADRDFAIARLTPTGQLDVNFNDGGLAVVDVNGPQGSNADDEAEDLAIQDDGKIVIAGSHGQNQAAVVRLLGSGVLDNTDNSPDAFSVDGMTTFGIGQAGFVGATSVALQGSDGGDNIIVAGFADTQLAVTQLSNSGTILTGFGPDNTGTALVSFTGGAVANDLAVNSLGQIVVVGNVNNQIISLTDDVTVSALPNQQDGLVVVFDPGGDDWTSFEQPPTGEFGFLEFNGVAIDADDRIVVGGAEEGDYVTAVFEMTPSVDILTLFAYDADFAPGLVHTDLATDVSPDPGFNQFDRGIGAFVLADGRIVVAGHSVTASESSTISAIRFATGDGEVEPPPNSEGDVEEVEGFPTYDDIHDPDAPFFDNVSAPAKFYALSQHDDNGVARLDLPPELDKANVVTIYNIMAGDGEMNVAVNIDGLALYYDPDDCTRIELYTKNFNDVITADDDVLIPLLIDAGDGNDIVTAGGADDVIFGGNGNDYINGNDGNDAAVGGAGNDNILGWRGNDILIGGLGSDLMFGYFGDNILIGGTTDHDGNVDALDALIDEWNSGAPTATRVNNIRNGGGLNGAVTLRTGVGATVFDDNARDFLTLGGSGDWFFLKNVNPNRDVTPAGNASVNDFV